MSPRHLSPHSQYQRPLHGLSAFHHTDQREGFQQFVRFSLINKHLISCTRSRDRTWKDSTVSAVPSVQRKIWLSLLSKTISQGFSSYVPLSEQLTRPSSPFSWSLCTNLITQKNAASLFHASYLVKILSLKRRGPRIIWLLQRWLTLRYLETCKCSQFY